MGGGGCEQPCLLVIKEMNKQRERIRKQEHPLSLGGCFGTSRWVIHHRTPQTPCARTKPTWGSEKVCASYDRGSLGFLPLGLSCALASALCSIGQSIAQGAKEGTECTETLSTHSPLARHWQRAAGPCCRRQPEGGNPGKHSRRRKAGDLY